MEDQLAFYSTPVLGNYPDNWEVVQCGEIFKKIGTRVKEINGRHGVPVLSMTRYQGLVLQSTKFEKTVASRDIANYKVVRKGDLVIGFPIDEGVISLQHRYPIGAVSPAYHVFEIIREVDKTYLDFVLKAPYMVQQYKKYSSNGVHRRRSLSPNDFLHIQIPLPPIQEQKAIAHALNTVRRAIDATECVIEATRELKKSMMTHFFTHGPVSVDGIDNNQLQNTEIGVMPKQWLVKTIGEIASTTSGGTPSRNRPDFFDGNNNWLKSGELVDSTINGSEEKITKEALENSNAKVFPVGTLLIALYGATTGKVGILDVEAATNQAIAAIFPKAGISSEYLMWALIYRREALLTERYGGAQPNISQTILSNFKVPIPPAEIQREIVKKLSAINYKLQEEENYLTLQRKVFDTMLNNLMSGSIRV